MSDNYLDDCKLWTKPAAISRATHEKLWRV